MKGAGWAIFAACLAAAVIPTGSAGARDYASRDIGGWTVAATDDGAGCFLTRQYDRTGDTTLLLGLDADGSNRLTVLNANWSIRPRDRQRLTFRLSGSAYPRQVAIGISSDGKQGFVTSFDARFPASFAASRMLDITRGDVTVERLDLNGSGAAVAELRKCVEAQRARPAGSGGVRQRADDIPRDPFAAPAARRPRS